MRDSCLPCRSCRLTLMVLGLTCVAAVVLSAAKAQAGSIVVPAWAFDRGNVVIDASPELADAGPVVVSGPEEAWGWRVEYDIEVPVEGSYTVQVCYASPEARPVEIFVNDRTLTKCCIGATFVPAPAGEPNQFTGKSSCARWECVLNYFERAQPISLKKGKNTIMFTRRAGPLPHFVAIRFDTGEEFPADWKPPKYKVKNIESVPAEYREAVAKISGLSEAAGKIPLWDTEVPKAAASLTIPAWSFARGNAKIYASPDQYGNAGPIVGSPSQDAEDGSLEYDIDFPGDGEYILYMKYASAEVRPLDVYLDDKHLGKTCLGTTFGSAPFEHPVRLTSDSSGAEKKFEGFAKDGKLVRIKATKGKHTLKLARKGPLPHIKALRIDAMQPFAEGWQQPKYKVADLESVPARERASFIRPDAVNIGAMELAIKDTMTEFGSQYPDGEKYLARLAELKKKQAAAEKVSEEEVLKVEDDLLVLRSEVMLGHPHMNFDKLIFLKRPSGGYGHTYTDQHANHVGGNLCILSPVSPDGKVTTLVPELEGGLFDRFDLSFDGTKVAFGYKKKDSSFKIYEIDIDPEAGKMVPGSLRQLTFPIDNETEFIKSIDYNKRCRSGGFDDMDPCYLPDGRIIFASTRSMRNVFCAGSTVTTLYIMDGDGKNMRCLSAGPINETAPAVLDDGRVIYTRWEYVDKGLGNGQSLWAVRPDGSGSDHVYKNNTVRPAGMSTARSIPGSRRFVAIGGTHHNTAVGPVILVDTRRSRRTTAAMECITPEIAYPCMGHPIREFGFFMDPFPFSEKLFITSHMPGQDRYVKQEKTDETKKRKKRGRNNYGLYVLDAWGNRSEIISDGELNCFEPIPLRPRFKPAKISPIAGKVKVLASEGATSAPRIGSLFIQDIYRGMKGIKRGQVKYIRVMGALKSPWNKRAMNVVGVDVHRKKVYGYVKVHEDGSVYFTAPADENLFFQAVDENFMMIQHMPTFINLMPGEQRSCIGCHEPRRDAPAMVSARPMAMENPPQSIQPLPGDTGPRAIHYAADVQPVLDRNCVSCHNEKDRKGNMDFTGELTGMYNRSYERIVQWSLISYMDCRYGRANFRAVPPLTHGSNRSLLPKQIMKAPCKSTITREEFIKIVTWIDANAPYYGTYEGQIDLKYKSEPNFRPMPLVGK